MRAFNASLSHLTLGLSCSLALFGSLARAEEPQLVMTGMVHEIGSSFGKTVARYELRKLVAPDGGYTSFHRFVDPASGKTLVEERLRVGPDGKAIEFHQDHLQIGAKGALRIQGSQLEFGWETPGKTKQESETTDEDVLVPPMLPDKIRANWDPLMNGKTVKVRLGVLDRTETVGFKLDKNEESEFQGKPSVTFRFKPTSFVIQAIVNPVMLTFDRQTRTLLRVVGRMPIKRAEAGGKFKDFDGDTLYTAVP